MYSAPGSKAGLKGVKTERDLAFFSGGPRLKYRKAPPFSCREILKNANMSAARPSIAFPLFCYSELHNKGWFP